MGEGDSDMTRGSELWKSQGSRGKFSRLPRSGPWRVLEKTFMILGFVTTMMVIWRPEKWQWLATTALFLLVGAYCSIVADQKRDEAASVVHNITIIGGGGGGGSGRG